MKHNFYYCRLVQWHCYLTRKTKYSINSFGKRLKKNKNYSDANQTIDITITRDSNSRFRQIRKVEQDVGEWFINQG